MEEEQKKSGRGKIIATAVAILLLIAAALAALWLLRDKKKDITFVAPAGLLEARNGAVYVADQGQNNIIRIDGDKRTLVAGYTLPADAFHRCHHGFLSHIKLAPLQMLQERTSTPVLNLHRKESGRFLPALTCQNSPSNT